MNQTRVGLGFDAHRFGGTPPLRLAGITIDPTRGLEATSDGDVAAHAIADALLGTADLGDLGTHFPSDDPRWRDADSMLMLDTVVKLVRARGFWVNNVDLTIVAQEVRIGPHRLAIKSALAEVLETDAVSVKATSTDHLGFTGRGEGIAALAVATVTI
jgi:2-C-methyl-D-erythritol 2,4-cyclodiphosphate synthase